MAFHLTVISAFAENAVGAIIKDAEAVAFALTHHPHSVVKVTAPEPAPPEPAPEPEHVAHDDPAAS